MPPPYSLITNFFRPFTAAGEAAASAARAIPTPDTSSDENAEDPTHPLPGAPDVDNDPRPRSQDGDVAWSAILRSQSVAEPTSSSALSSLPPSQPTPKLPRTVNTAARENLSTDASLLQPSDSESVERTTIKKEPIMNGAPPTNSKTLFPSKPVQAANSSFSSNSSRRIVKGNIKAVTNSDSDDFSDSDDDLIDLDVLFARKRRKVTPPAGSLSKPYVIPDEPVQAGSSASSRHRLTDLPRPRKPVYKHSLQSMVKQHKAHQAVESRIRESEARLAAAETLAAERASAGIVADEVLGDDDDKERIKAAIERIEVGDEERPFYFFRSEPDKIAPSTAEFPIDALPDVLKGLCSTSQRRSFFTSGFAADVARTKGLPDQLLLWAHRQLLYEKDSRLCDAYLAVLEATDPAGLPFAIRKDLTIRSRYADETCFDNDTAAAGTSQLPPSLIYVLRSLRTCAAATSNEDRVSALVELVLLNADEHVSKSLDHCREIEHTIITILDSQDEPGIRRLLTPAISQLLEQKILTPHQLYRTIARLPSSTARLHKFRRLLALHCVLAADATELVDPSSPNTEARLLVALKRDDRFIVRKNSSWAAFEALVQVLDIAIDDGFSDFSFIHDQQPRAAQQQLSILNPASKSTNEDEHQFNKRIDSLSKQLRVILNNIKDGGTSNLRRTEAKHALERLCVRVETSVRTKSKVNASLFGGPVGGAQRDLLDKFLKKYDGDGRQEILQQDQEGQSRHEKAHNPHQEVQG